MVTEDSILIRDKAIRFALRTGESLNLDLVWHMQEQDGHCRCFGAYEPSCPTDCRWLSRCRALTSEPVFGPLPRPAARDIAAPASADRAVEERWVPPSLRRRAATVPRPRPL